MKIFRSVIIGIGCSTLCTIILLVLLSFFLVNNNVKEELIPILVSAFLGCSVLCGAIISTRKIQKNGAMYGLTMSFLYIFIIYIFSSIYMNNFSLQIQSICMIICTLVLGTIGGIIGINIK